MIRRTLRRVFVILLNVVNLPGLMQPIKHTEFDVENIYVDGGVLFNYPIECFDGEYACAFGEY